MPCPAHRGRWGRVELKLLGCRSNLWESELEVFGIRFPTSADKMIIAIKLEGWTPLFYKVLFIRRVKIILETVKWGRRR